MVNDPHRAQLRVANVKAYNPDTRVYGLGDVTTESFLMSHARLVITQDRRLFIIKHYTTDVNIKKGSKIHFYLNDLYLVKGSIAHLKEEQLKGTPICRVYGLYWSKQEQGSLSWPQYWFEVDVVEPSLSEAKRHLEAVSVDENEEDETIPDDRKFTVTVSPVEMRHPNDFVTLKKGCCEVVTFDTSKLSIVFIDDNCKTVYLIKKNIEDLQIGEVPGIEDGLQITRKPFSPNDIYTYLMTGNDLIKALSDTVKRTQSDYDIGLIFGCKLYTDKDDVSKVRLQCNRYVCLPTRSLDSAFDIIQSRWNDIRISEMLKKKPAAETPSPAEPKQPPETKKNTVIDLADSDSWQDVLDNLSDIKVGRKVQDFIRACIWKNSDMLINTSNLRFLLYSVVKAANGSDEHIFKFIRMFELLGFKFQYHSKQGWDVVEPPSPKFEVPNVNQP
jgi:hypothetical protein